ncbi:MAG: sensor histidine kinase [Herbinix sp.]|nr:sensor histidine kinase [Herbinix sp.]
MKGTGEGMKVKKRTSIKTKIIFSCMIVIASIILILGIVVYQYFSKILLDSAIQDNEERLNEISDQLDSIEYQMSYIADYIITDRAVAEYTYVDHQDSLAEINEDVYNMKEVLTRFVVINEYLTGISMLRDDGVAFTNSANLDRKYVSDYIQAMLNQRELEKKENRRFTNVHEVYANNINKKMNVITYIARYKNIKNSGQINYLFLDVSYDSIVDIMKQGESEFDSVILLNKENDVYYGDVTLDNEVYRQLIESDTSKMIKEDKYIYILNINKNSNWKTIVSISKSKLFQTITPIMIAFVGALVLGFMIIVMILIPILSGIINPMKQLTEGMKLVSKGNYKIKVNVHSNDEIEELAAGFNHMTTKIEKSIEETIQYEKTKKNLQLELLMNQINPHFIYNTLNTVIYMAHADKTEAVEDVTYSLIKVLQDSVKIGKDSICDYTSVEIEIVKNYMRIQKYRYPDMFEFIVMCDDSLLEKFIPKMLIQPLVENALFHGVCLSEHFCQITVSIKRMTDQEEKDRIELCIQDNGIGMDEETLNRSFLKKQKAKGSNQTRGIGLSNIKERLEFIYGNNYTIEITSEQKVGTKVFISIPVLDKMIE